VIAAQRQSTQSVSLPAPVKGIVAQSLFGAESAIGPDAAIFLYNMIPGEYGCRVRKGSRAFAVDLGGEVRTLMYYNTTTEGGTEDHFFAATPDGIFDITAGGESPWTPVLAWPSPGGKAGWCSYHNWTNVAGDQYLLVCDEANGYYTFDGTTWTKGPAFTLPSGATWSLPLPDNMVQVTEWNGRIWFVERDTATAWYLDPLAYTGDITPLDVGSRFSKGGHLVQISTWTLDDGAGMDDKLVMCGSGGDILIFEGLNPDTPNFRLLGRWDVGQVPAGRRVMSQWGGNIKILSIDGIQDISILLEGQTQFPERTAATYNISRYIRAFMEDRLDEYGWALHLVPEDAIAAVLVPDTNDTATDDPIQFVVSSSNAAWCQFRGLDMVCANDNVNGFYYGTRDGQVRRYQGTVDDVDLAGENAESIVFSILTHYSDLGAPAAWKRPQFIRPHWVGQAQPSYDVKARFDFDLAELATAPPYVLVNPSLWDAAIWDVSNWGGTAQSYQETLGLKGMGRHVALALRGSSVADLSLLGFDFMFDTGGLL
jgi:hypothetical protein